MADKESHPVEQRTPENDISSALQSDGRPSTPPVPGMRANPKLESVIQLEDKVSSHKVTLEINREE